MWWVVEFEPRLGQNSKLPTTFLVRHHVRPLCATKRGFYIFSGQERLFVPLGKGDAAFFAAGGLENAWNPL